MSAPTPPRSSDGVFFVSTSLVINAPRDKVWHNLLNFSAYKDWNPFVRGQIVVDASSQPLADQTPVAGKYILMAPVHLPPTMGEPGIFQKQSAFVVITLVDHEQCRCAWETRGLPSFLLHTNRWQILTQQSDRTTKYETIEVFGGLLAYVIKFLMRDKLRAGFEAMAEGLKRISESS
ncbi:hypothetical protein AX16_003394 [Volvariella volvacea WC 439]|nr:hypothetical protein AX16_003394 [Volvariella volvacea WC 439]